MTAPVTLAEQEVTADPVLAAWALYRRSQTLPMPPNAGDLFLAQDKLHSLVGPYCCTAAAFRVLPPPDLDAIEDAVDGLLSSIEWHFGAGTAALISAWEESVLLA